MPRRPDILPLFATGAPVGAIVEPTEQVRVNGFPPGARPPAQWDNYAWNTIGAWLDFLRGFSLSNWERFTSTAVIGRMGVDLETAETTVSLHRIVTCAGTATATTMYASVRGQTWSTLTPSNSGWGIARCIAYGLNRWFVGTGTDVSGAFAGTGKIWCTFPDGSPYATAGHLSAITSSANPWTAVSVPGGTTDVRAMFASPDGVNIAAVTNTAILAAQAIAATPPLITGFVAATISGGAPTGKFIDVVYTGTAVVTGAWVAVTDAGELYRATIASGTWTKLGTTLTSTGSTFWRLSADGNGIVVAYIQGGSSSSAFYVSTDHGVTWPTGTAPPYLSLSQLQWVDGAWIATTLNAPYLATSKNLAAGSWLRLPTPYMEGQNHDCSDFVFTEGAIVVAGDGFALVSQRAEDMSPAPWTPSTAVNQLHDCAYLRGLLISSTAPTNGQVLAWNSTDSQYEPITVGGGGSVSSPQTGTVTWSAQQTFTGGIYGGAGTLVLGVATGQTIFFDVNGSSVAQIGPSGMLSVGTVPTSSGSGVVSASTGFAGVDPTTSALVPLLSFGSASRVDLGSNGYQTNVKGSEVTFPSVAFGSLPATPPAGSMVYCNNARVGAEGAGVGTGALVIYKTSGPAGAGWYVVGVYTALAAA